MAERDIYTNLFQRKIGARHGAKVYAGADHILVTSGMLVERFNRVFFDEIESIEVQPSNRRLRQVFFALVAFFIAEGIGLALVDENGQKAFLFLGLLPLLYALISFLRGPSVHLFLNTRVSRIPVPCISRWGHAVKLIRKIEALVEPMQGEGWYATDVGRDAPRQAPVRDGVWRSSVEPLALLACLGGCTLCLMAALLTHWVWALAVMLPLLVVFSTSLLSLIRNRKNRVPVFVKGWLWLLFVFSWIVINWGLAIGGAVSAFQEITAFSGTAVDRSGEAFQVATQFFHGTMYGLAACFLMLAVLGGMALSSRIEEGATAGGTS